MAGGIVVWPHNCVNYSGEHSRFPTKPFVPEFEIQGVFLNGRGGIRQFTGRGATKKERRLAESQTPPLQLNQFFVYLRDHLLLDKNVDILSINYKTIFSNSMWA